MFGKNFKKLLAILMALAMVFTMFACAPTEEKDDGDDEKGGGNSVNLMDGLFGERENPLKDVDLTAMTDEEAMKTVEETSLKGAVGVLMEVLTATSKAGSTPTSATGLDMNVTLRPGKMLLTQLQGSMGSNEMVDLSKLTSLGLDMDMVMNGDMMKALVELSVNGKSIADAEMIADLAAMTVWLGLPSLSNQYLMMDLETLTAMGGAQEALPNYGYNSDSWGGSQSVAMVGQATSPAALLQILPKIVPDPEKLEPLLIKYIGVMLDQIEDITRTNSTINVEGVEQDVVQLNYTITEEDLYNMIVAMLEEMRDDAELKVLIDELGDNLSEVAKEMGESFDVDLYSMFTAFVDQALTEFEDQLMFTFFNPNNYIEIITVLDKENMIIGRMFRMCTNDVRDTEFVYLTATNGNNQATVVEFTATNYGYTSGMNITGTATLKDGIVNQALYTAVALDGNVKHEYGTLELKDVTANSATIIIKPSEDIMYSLFRGEIDDAALKLVVGGDKLTIEILMDDELFVGLDMVVKTTNATSIKKPTNSIDITDTNKLQDWASTLDVNKIIKKLNATGVTNIPNIG